MAYTYVVAEDKRKVVCLSSFAGRVVRGIAKCDPNDVFDVEDGKKLATKRCDLKIAKKRKQQAARKLALAKRLRDQAELRVKEMEAYLYDASDDLVVAEAQLAKCIEDIATKNSK